MNNISNKIGKVKGKIKIEKNLDFNRAYFEKCKKKYEEKKKMNIKIFKKMRRLANSREEIEKKELMQRAFNILDCSDYIEIGTCPDCGRKSIINASLCRDRLCPICQWRLSSKRALEMAQILQKIRENHPNMQYRFITLTQKNINGDELGEELKRINAAWKKIMDIERKYKIYEGFARIIEITYNPFLKNFHPHMHIIAAVERKDFWDENTWRERWKKAMKLDYIPICDERGIKGIDENQRRKKNIDENKEELVKSALEAFKYSIKSSDIDNMDMENFRYLIYAIKNKRFVSYSGIFKKMRQELNMKSDTEIDNEIDIKKCRNCDEDLIVEAMRWSFKEKKYRKLSNGGGKK